MNNIDLQIENLELKEENAKLRKLLSDLLNADPEARPAAYLQAVSRAQQAVGKTGEDK